jgi:beta-glucanase (GH16 family)
MRSMNFGVQAGILIALYVFAIPCAMAAQLDRSPLVVTFSEEFDGQSLDVHHPVDQPTGKWKTRYDHGNQATAASRVLEAELQVYSDIGYNDVNPFRVAGGVLTIEADRVRRSEDVRNSDRPYTSGIITTSPSFRQRYGYFEMRAQLPVGDGLWPAFWLLAPYRDDITSPQYPGEIDVVEFLGRDAGTIYCSIHWPTRPDYGEKKSTTIKVPSNTGTWRTYGVLWTAHSLVWYVDDVEVARTSNPGLHRPMYLIANLAIGGGWGGPPSSTTIFPAAFKIDWIRAYRMAEPIQR